MLPFSSASGESCGLLTALFTATSATCVTGLVLVDTLISFTLFGQVVILLMIQLGGLGFMTVLYLMAQLIQRRLSLSQRLVMMSAFNLNDMGDVLQLLKRAWKLTFCLEGAGAVVLTLCFIPRFGLGAVWKGIFISVSAFCNAGFDLLGPEGAGSLSSCSGNPIILFTIAVLIVCGGLGFFVWEDILKKRAYRPLTLYSKIVLWMTGALLAIGTLFFLGTEFTNPDTFGQMPIWQRGVNALFQSVTLRTAGFTTVDQGALRDVSVVMSVLLMLVGGSSGSTAGGLKTATLGILLLSVWTGIHGRDTVVLRGRTIPQRKVLSALTLVIAVILIVFAASMAVAIIEKLPYLSVLYEVVSAIATVGLTTGITSGLSGVSQVILMLLMYLGRVGIMSLSLAFLAQRRGQDRISYPEVEVMIG